MHVGVALNGRDSLSGRGEFGSQCCSANKVTSSLVLRWSSRAIACAWRRERLCSATSSNVPRTRPPPHSDHKQQIRFPYHNCFCKEGVQKAAMGLWCCCTCGTCNMCGPNRAWGRAWDVTAGLSDSTPSCPSSWTLHQQHA